ncbi:hypothetical protein CBS101457_000717 [Exobasidium rhododendri]|nr:hypothetical protein CBS101457_000717 [Exobasidium rhododendri]
MAEEAPASRRTSSRVANRPINDEKAAALPPTAQIKRKPVDAPPNAGKKAKTEETSAAIPAKEDKKTSDDSKTSSPSKLLEVGSQLPSIVLKDESGADVDIGKLKKTVMFTYPKANTPGCTTQACSFRDEYSKFQAAGFHVFGLSSDNEGPLKSWKDKKGFTYSLLSDPKRRLIGPLTGSTTSTIRSHFVIDGDGRLAHSAIKVKPVESSANALKFAQGL